MVYFIMKKNTEFLERLIFLKNSRPTITWERNLDLERSSIQNMFDGQLPSIKALTRIAVVEQVNIDWLLFGNGNPYHRHEWLEGTALIDQLTSEINSGANATLMTNGIPSAILIMYFTHSDNYEARLYSNLDKDVLEFIAAKNLWEFEVSIEQFEKFSSGQAGPPLLIKLMKPGLPFVQKDKLIELIKSNERIDLSDDEKLVLSGFERLNKEKKAAVKLVIESMGQNFS